MSEADEVDTQPLTPPTICCPIVPDTWGWLLPQVPNLQPVVLHRSSYDLGRDPVQADILLQACHVGEQEQEGLTLKVSRVHLNIGLEEGSPNLTDNSMNGTWVGGLKVGRGRRCRLEHCSTIALLSAERKLFIFLERATMEQLYPAVLTQRFLVGEVLGSGTTAEVRLGYRLSDFSQVALKLVKKTEWPSKYSRPSNLRSEVEVLADLSHVCITKVEEVVETETLLVIVMELATGGELFDQVLGDKRNKQLQEDTAKFQFYQLVDTTKYLHSKQVCHRDLKLENLLLSTPGPRSLIKLCDFGLAKVWGGGAELETYVGTPVYMAPEVVACAKSGAPSYSSKSDCWSLGVILYLLLSGTHPFQSGEGMAPMVGRRWEMVSGEAKHLVMALLEIDPVERLSAEDALCHPWIANSPFVVEAVTKLMRGEDPALDRAEVGRATTEGKLED